MLYYQRLNNLILQRDRAIASVTTAIDATKKRMGYSALKRGDKTRLRNEVIQKRVEIKQIRDKYHQSKVQLDNQYDTDIAGLSRKYGRKTKTRKRR
jgi:hypothetical protein